MNPYMLVLDKGEMIHESILKHIQESKIPSASLSGLGAIKDPELAYYNLEIKKYESEVFPGIYEVASLNGDITTAEGKLTSHIHVVISGPDHSALAGHLVTGEVGITLEVTVVPFSEPLYRKLNPEIGLNLITSHL